MNIDVESLSDGQVKRLFQLTGGKAIDDLTDDEVVKVYSFVQSENIKIKEPEEGFLSKAGDVGLKALDGAARVLDYGGGLTRTGAAQIADAVSENDVVTSDDWLKALAGQAPLSADYLERIGLGEGATLSEEFPSLYDETGEGWFTFQKDGPLDISQRDVAGFAIDTLTDPLFYLTGGLSAAGKVGKVGARVAQSGKGAMLQTPKGSRLRSSAGKIRHALETPSRMMEGAGRGMYRSGLKNLDEGLEKMGKDPKAVKDFLFDNRITGSYKAVQKKANELAGKLDNEIQTLYRQAADKGAMLDPDDLVKYAQGRIIEMGDDIVTYDDALKAAEELVHHVMKGPRTLKQATKTKSNLYRRVKDAGYDQTKKNSFRTDLDKNLANAYKTSIEDAAERAMPGGGDAIRDANEQLGYLLTPEKQIMREAGKEGRKNLVTVVDGALAGFVAKDPKNAWMLGFKKAAEFANKPGFKTRAGRLMYDVAPVVDDPLRRAFIYSQSPWSFESEHGAN